MIQDRFGRRHQDEKQIAMALKTILTLLQKQRSGKIPIMQKEEDQW
jgi:hypothetical protein